MSSAVVLPRLDEAEQPEPSRANRRVCATDRGNGCEPRPVSRASQGPSNRSRSTPTRAASRPSSRPANRAATGREADRIKSARSGWASPAAAVSTFWRSGPLPLPLAGLAAGLWAALTGLVVTVVLTLFVWIFAAGESASDTAMRVGTDIWLAAHGTPFVVGDGVWTLLPWAWVVFPSFALWAAGRWVAHRGAVAYPKSLVVASASVAVAYATVALMAALFGTVSGASAMPVRAALHAGALAFVVAGVAMAWRANLGREGFQRAWTLVRPAVAGLAVLTMGAAVALLASLILSHAGTATLLDQVQPGFVGGAALLIAWLGYLPAALMWALSYSVGTGVTVAGATVTPTSSLDSTVEMLGLHLLPTTAQPWWMIGALTPIAAGVVLSRIAGTAASKRDWLLARAAALAVLLIAVDLWWAISVGRIGGGRLDVLGPPPMVIAVLAAGVAVGVLLEVVGTRIRRWWSGRHVVDVTDRTRGSGGAGEPSDLTDADGSVSAADVDPADSEPGEPAGSPPPSPGDGPDEPST